MPSIDYDRIASEYAKHRKVNPGVLTELISSVGLRDSSKVLDVGCGTGNYLVVLKSLTGCACWGIDPSKQMLSKAKQQLSEASFQVGEAESLHFPDEFFDLVFSVDTIHHLASVVDFFREAFRVLRTNGKVCTVTDSEWIIRHREPLSVYFPETIEIELKRYPSIPQLSQTMNNVGFRELQEKMVGFPYELKDSRAFRDKAHSSLHLIPEEAFQRGLEQMERDLLSGPINCVSRYLLLWGRKVSKA